MLEVKAKIREWGRSLGIVLPKEEIKKEGLKKDDTVTVLIAKKKNVLRDTFGIIKLKRSTDEILKESDRESWDE
ncbi:AbrB/MazE/SpoVT family DNA-binding domain-containing protein [Candidatus Woesearchaeota archaeon]|nr:AbrB/MazE/SpoVT family DNA-binding domain-containing protein [Candidatus Woesearchaeota archaeon]